MPAGMRWYVAWLAGVWLGGVPAGSFGQGAPDLSELRVRVGLLRERTTELAGTDDLLDTLHFGWFYRPYARATLAVLVKITGVLEREVRLREMGNGAISDSALTDMLSWAQEALGRIVAPEAEHDFRPHRLGFVPADISSEGAAPSLFGFVDQATATRHDRRFGELDLMMAAGLRVYPRLLSDLKPATLDSVLFDRAGTLGALVVAAGVLNEASSGDSPDAWAAFPSDRVLVVEPVRLRAALGAAAERSVDAGHAAALVDSTSPESVGGWLARRGLARGMGGGTRYIIDSWQPPAVSQPLDARAAATAAAMWIDAFEGEALGLMHGWRDFRDGSGSLHPSLFSEPAYIETVAITALDIMRLTSYVARFRERPDLLIRVGTDAVDEHNDNAWAEWTEPVWEALLQRHIRFDITAQRGMADKRAQDRYRLVVSLGREDGSGVAAFVRGVEDQLAGRREDAAPPLVREQDGSPAGSLYVRQWRTLDGRPCAAIVNLSGEGRRLSLYTQPALGAAKDMIHDEVVKAPEKATTLAAWQVRLLWPVD